MRQLIMSAFSRARVHPCVSGLGKVSTCPSLITPCQGIEECFTREVKGRGAYLRIRCPAVHTSYAAHVDEVKGGRND